MVSSNRLRAKDNAPAFGTPSLLKEGEGGVCILKAGVSAVMEDRIKDG
jgi:hypothetical protein